MSEGAAWVNKPANLSNKAFVGGLVKEKGYYGMTVVEVREATGLHHGQASGSLSMLHKDKSLARLADKRSGHSIYVDVDKVGFRETIARK